MADQQPQQAANTGGSGQDAPMDYLDKAVNAGMDKSGHHQNRGTVEKVSDGIRSAFKKATGKDVPGGDK
ncbi:unnamed protein product [Jaminaea pallidilutea]